MQFVKKNNHNHGQMLFLSWEIRDTKLILIRNFALRVVHVYVLETGGVIMKIG